MKIACRVLRRPVEKATGQRRISCEELQADGDGGLEIEMNKIKKEEKQTD